MNRLHIKLLTVAVAAMSFLPSMGQETLVLKNGSTLYGHTSVENYEDGEVSFMVDSAIVVEKLTNIDYENPPLVQLDNFSNMRLKEWLKKHPERIILKNGRKHAYLGNIRSKGNYNSPFAGNAVVLAKNDSTATFFTLSQVTINLNKAKEFDHIIYAERDPLALVGVVDEIVTINGETLRGQIVAQYPGYFVILTDDGVRHSVNKSDIRSRKKLAYNSNRPLADQMNFLSKITLKKGKSTETIDGIIRETVSHPANGEKPYYDVVNSDDSYSHKYKFEEVTKLSLSPNPRFVKERDVVIDDDEDILIAGRKAVKVPCTITDTRYEFNDTIVTAIPYDELTDGKLKVYYKDVPANSEFFFVEVTPAQEQPAPAKGKKATTKKLDVEEDEAPYSVGLSKIMLNGFAPVGRFVSPASNVSVNYGPLRTGKYYVLIRKSDNSAYLIYIDPAVG